MKKQFGVNGISVREELLKRTSYLNEVYENVISNVKPLEKAAQYYSIFTKHIAGVAYSLPLLSYLIGEKFLHILKLDRIVRMFCNRCKTRFQF